MAGFAVTTGVELNDAEIAQADLPRIDGLLSPLR